MEDQMQNACPDEALAEILALAGGDEAAAVERLLVLLDDHAGDPRLHFLHGSLLAALARYDEGRAAMARAVALAPGYDVARFQLGLLELSSGDAAAAGETLRPLAEADGGLSLLARGLRHLARDELAAAADCLRRGVERNHEHPLINRDMAMMIDRIEQEMNPAREAPEDVSAAHLLLRQYAAKNTRH